MYHAKATVCCVLLIATQKQAQDFEIGICPLPYFKLEQTLLNGDISALIDASSVSFDNLFSIVEEHMQHNTTQLHWVIAAV